MLCCCINVAEQSFKLFARFAQLHAITHKFAVVKIQHTRSYMQDTVQM